MNFENQILIERSVEDVFAFITDPEGGTAWHRANRIEPLSRDPIGLGSKYRVQGRFLFWKFDSVSEVTEYETNRLVTYESDAGMYTYRLRYTLEEIDGRTRLTETGHANPTGLLKFAIRLFAGGADQNSKRGLALLKQVLEESG